MIENKAGGYISKVVFNDGKTIDIKKDDIIVFVGPNNAGKSQSLKDIYTLSKNKQPSVVISDIEITKYNTSLREALDSVSEGKDAGNTVQYQSMGKHYNYYDFSDSHFQQDNYYGEFRNIFVANLDTSARLTISNPPNSIKRDGDKMHPIHYAAFNKVYRKWLSDSFKKAFGVGITPNILYGSVIPLCIGDSIKLEDKFDDEQERQEEYAAILETYKQVQNQGDGIKSFTGILLYLMLDYYCTFLIDEPESFLHPPQAKIMGQIIGETLSNSQQAFISTHSEDILKGLLEVCPERIKVIRITREDDKNSFSILDSNSFSDVWNDPLLKHSNIMSSLFHKNVVLCESDSDCKMYSIVESHIKQKDNKYSETLFIHCGGKHRMSKIVTALSLLNVKVKLIVDIDVLNDKNVLKGLVEAFDGDWKAIESDYNTIVSNLHSPVENINRISAKTSINQVLDGSNSVNLSEKEIGEIKNKVKSISKWDNLKKCGISAIPAGDASNAYHRIDEFLRNIGIYVVPVGELECFVKAVGGHGPEWVNDVLESYPDLDDKTYSEVTEFIKTMSL